MLRTFLFDYIERSMEDTTAPEKPLNIIVRKSYLVKNESFFGYYRPLVSSKLKRIVFKYLDSLDMLVAFLTSILCGQADYKVESIVIEDLQ